MSDLISREAVRMGRIPYDEDLTEYQRGWNDACDAIADNAPEAQRDYNASYSRSHENDTISRQAAIDAVDDVPYIKDHPNIGLLWKAWLEQFPPAQPEIIRCKDCKHYKEWESETTPNAVVTQCMADNFPIRKAIPDGWFCAGAERKRK